MRPGSAVLRAQGDSNGPLPPTADTSQRHPHSQETPRSNRADRPFSGQQSRREREPIEQECRTSGSLSHSRRGRYPGRVWSSNPRESTSVFISCVISSKRILTPWVYSCKSTTFLACVQNELITSNVFCITCKDKLIDQRSLDEP